MLDHLARARSKVASNAGPNAQNGSRAAEGLIMRRSFVGLACATFILFASSSASLVIKLGETENPAVVVAAAATTEHDLNEVEARPADDKVKLLDAGIEPRRALRIRPVVGSTIQTVVEGRIGLDTQIDGESVATGPTPGFRMLLVQRVDRVQLNGTVQFVMSYTAVGAVGGPGIDPALVAEVNAALGDLEGLSGSAEVDARGRSSVRPSTPAKSPTPWPGACLTPFSHRCETCPLPSRMSRSASVLAGPWRTKPPSWGSPWTPRPRTR